MPKGKAPKEAANHGGDRSRHDQVKHEPARLPERFDQQSRGNVRDDHNGNNPSENEAEKFWKNDVRITRDIEEIEVTVNQTLRADDPEADGGEAEHDRIVDGHAKAERDQIKEHCAHARSDLEPGEREQYDRRADHGIDHAVEAKLFGRNCEL